MKTSGEYKEEPTLRSCLTFYERHNLYVERHWTDQKKKRLNFLMPWLKTKYPAPAQVQLPPLHQQQQVQQKIAAVANIHSRKKGNDISMEVSWGKQCILDSPSPPQQIHIIGNIKKNNIAAVPDIIQKSKPLAFDFTLPEMDSDLDESINMDIDRIGDENDISLQKSIYSS